MKQRILAVVLVGLFGLVACKDNSQPAGTIFVSGRIEGDESNIAPKQSGRVIEVAVHEGQLVKAGDVLVRLSGKQMEASQEEASAKLGAAQRRVEQSREQVRVLESRLSQIGLQQNQASVDAQGRVAQAEGQLAAAQAEMARAQAEYDQNQLDSQRYTELAKKGAVAQQQAEQYTTRAKTSKAILDATQRQVAAAEGAVSIARAALSNPDIRAADRVELQRQIDQAKVSVRVSQADAEAAQATVARAQADVEDLVIAAPFDGVVVTRVAEPGQVVGAGTTLLTMVNPAALYLRGFVPEGQIGQVKAGQRAEIFLDSAPGQAIPAEVMRIDPEAMFTPENTYFKEDRVRQVVGVKLLLKGGDGSAKLGMPADANIYVDDQKAGNGGSN